MNSKECKCSNCRWLIDCELGRLQKCEYELDDGYTKFIEDCKKRSICIYAVDKQGNQVPFSEQMIKDIKKAFGIKT